LHRLDIDAAEQRLLHNLIFFDPGAIAMNWIKHPLDSNVALDVLEAVVCDHDSITTPMLFHFPVAPSSNRFDIWGYRIRGGSSLR
jgi:hypothetical protein